MTLAQLNRAVFDHLRRLENPDAQPDPGSVATDGYLLTDDEAEAARTGDVGAFHVLGVHPVLINAYARANGWKGEKYRVLFPEGSDQVTFTARWTGFASRAAGTIGNDGRVRLSGGESDKATDKRTTGDAGDTGDTGGKEST